MSSIPANYRNLGLIRTSMIYALGDLFTKGARVILVPYYVIALTKPELGQLAILTAITLLSWTLGGLGLPLAVQRQYFDYGDHGKRFVCNAWSARLLGGLPLLAVVWLSIGYLSKSEMTWMVPPWLVACAITSGFLRGGVSIMESLFIVRQQPVQYRTFTFAQFLFSTLLIVLLVSGFGWGISGAVIGELIGWSLWTLLSAVLLLKESLPDWQEIRWTELAKYCGSALPHSLFMWGLTSFDRIQLPYLGLSLARIGVYDVAYQLASYLSIVTLALRSAWLPKYFSQVSQQAETVNEEYGRTATLFFGFVLSAGSLGVLLAPELLHLFVKSATPDHIQIFRLIILAGIGMACFIAFNQPLLSDRRIGWVAVASATGLAVNICLNFWLVPYFGITGAAISTVLAYSSMAGFMLLLVLKWYPIHWQARSACLLFSGAFVTYVVSWFLGESAFTWNLSIRLIVGAAFACLVILTLPVLRNQMGGFRKLRSGGSKDALQT